MNRITLKQKSIIKKIETLSPEWLEELDKYIQFIIYQSEIKGTKGHTPSNKRKFGCGKHIVVSISDDFNEPLDDFKEYM